MSALDAAIDELYGLPLAAFTAARNALAKSLKGDERALVKRLEKPAVAPWAVNQLYWRERRTYDRLMAEGRALRSAQIDTLEGTSTDLHGSTADHRAALAAALATATRLAAQAGASPAPDPLARMLEALSLAPEPAIATGRFTEVIQLAGFEALAGVTRTARTQAVPSSGEAAGRLRAEQAAAARRTAEAAVVEATRKREEATATETRARALADLSRQQLTRAKAALDALTDRL